MSEHRVPMLGASWRRFEDPTVSRDPRVRAVVGALATLPSPELRTEFRAELRAQLVAIAPRIVAESADAAPLVDIVPGKARSGARARHSDSALARTRSIRLGRPLAVAASVITAFALLFGGAVWMSQKALPGDTLYGLKRASESWQLATATSSTDKARDYLNFAKTRIDEASQLAARATGSAAGLGPQAGGIDAHTASLIASTLASSDHDVASAASLLGWKAVHSKSAAPLGIMTSQAPDLVSRLNDLAASLPDGASRNRVESSAALVASALNRAKALGPVASCLQSPASDRLGPIPGSCAAPGTTRPNQTHGGSTPGTTRGSKSHTVAPNGQTKSSATPAAGGSTSTTAPGAPGSSSSSAPIINLPSLLPTSTPTLPVTINSCSVGVNIGPIGIGIGGCS